MPAIWQQVIADSGFALASDFGRSNLLQFLGQTPWYCAFPRDIIPACQRSPDPTRWSRVEPILSRVVGQPCTIRVETVAEAASQSAAMPIATAQAAVGTRQYGSELLQIPLVQKARDVLGAQILYADPISARR